MRHLNIWPAFPLELKKNLPGSRPEERSTRVRLLWLLFLPPFCCSGKGRADAAPAPAFVVYVLVCVCVLAGLVMSLYYLFNFFSSISGQAEATVVKVMQKQKSNWHTRIICSFLGTSIPAGFGYFFTPGTCFHYVLFHQLVNRGESQRKCQENPKRTS